MRKNVLLLGAMMMASMSLMAQTKGGGISQSALQQMEKNQQAGVANKALFNAIANNSIDDLVKNHANGPLLILISASRLLRRAFTTRRVRAVAGCSAVSTCSVPTLLSTTSRVEWWSILRIISSSMISWRRLT